LTDPWGYADQPSFLNCAVEISTGLSPVELLELAKGIERDLGRQDNFRFGPRLIDIDLLLYGRDTVHLCRPDLQIPHPRMTERAFVLVPLAEIAPETVHPSLKVTLAHLLEMVAGKEGVKLWGLPTSLPGQPPAVRPESQPAGYEEPGNRTFLKVDHPLANPMRSERNRPSGGSRNPENETGHPPPPV
jgi:2-amino-4-hydroxy-6-hydroxymethyldihydropteridine diphosphokinase